MKKMSLKPLSLMFVVLAMLVGGCAGVEDQEQPGANEAALNTATQEAKDDSISTQGLCKQAWTCNSSNYYATQARCVEACGGQECWREHNCNGGCICP
jgi:hypothetical protein